MADPHSPGSAAGSAAEPRAAEPAATEPRAANSAAVEPRVADSAAAEPRVAEVLQQLRSGVRQRGAELAVQGEAAQEARQGLLALRSREYVQEPIAFSHRRRLGRFVVLARKSFFHLFLKWFLRPVLEQQNGFNQAAGRLFQELVEAQDRLARELRQASARLDAAERRLAAPAAAAPASPAAAPPAPASPAAAFPVPASPAAPPPARGDGEAAG